MALAVCKDYEASLEDLTFNSKPLINMLTMLADENREHAAHIVRLVEKRIHKAQGAEKLPSIYLMDSIIKNVKGGPYLALFSKNLIQNFCGVFEKVDEKIRQSLFKLRSTWTAFFSADQLYALDLKVKQRLDPAWPVMATPTPTQQPTPTASTSIHVNPKFIKKQVQVQAPAVVVKKTKTDVKDLQQKENVMRQNLVAKQQELLQIHKQRLELELQQTKAKLQEQALELERKNLEIQRQKILQQQQHQVLAAQAAMATPDVTPVASVVPTTRLAPPQTQGVSINTPAVANAVPQDSYEVAPAGWGSTQMTPPQPGSEQAPSLFEVITKRADPRTAASKRDPRLANRDPRLRGQPTSQPQATLVEKKLPIPSKPSVPVSSPAQSKAIPVPPKQAQDPRLNKMKGQKMSDVRMKAKPAQQVKAVVPPVKKVEKYKENVVTKKHIESKQIQDEVKIDLTGEDDVTDTVIVESKSRKKEDSHSPREREGSRDGSRSPRGSKISRTNEKRKETEPRGRTDRTSSSRRSSRNTKSRSRSRSPAKSRSPPPRRTSKYGRSSRRRGSDEKERSKDKKDDRERSDKERKEDKAKARDRRDEHENRENRDISKLGRIPRKSDTKRVEESKSEVGAKRKISQIEGRGPIERDLKKPVDLDDLPLKRARFERMDFPERFSARGGRFRCGRGIRRGGFHEREMPPYYGPDGGMVSPPIRRRRSSIDPSVVIPKELSSDKMSALLTQADRQLHSGQITRDEHQKILIQLEDLYQFQKIQEEKASPPEKMDSIVEGRTRYHYRLGGGRLEREELPESDDSYVMDIARKLEYQKRMTEPRVNEPVDSEKNETSQERVAPVGTDVDLRVFDPNYQKLVKQQKVEDFKIEVTKEKELGNEMKAPAKVEAVSQIEDREKEKASDKKMEGLVKIESSADGQTDSSKDPEPAPMEIDPVPTPPMGKSGEDEKDKLQGTKDSEPIQISPLSPPPEDRDERLTAVVREKMPDEQETTSDGKDEPSKLAVDKGEPMDVVMSISSNEIKNDQKASKDVDDRVELETSDVDERIGLVKKDVDEREVKLKDVDQRESEKEDVDERQLKHKPSNEEENEQKHLDERKTETKDIDERKIGVKQMVELSEIKSQKVEENENEVNKISMDTVEKLPEGPVQNQNLNQVKSKDSESVSQGDTDLRNVAQKEIKDDKEVKKDQAEPPEEETVAAVSSKKSKPVKERKKRKPKQGKGAGKKKVADEDEKSESIEKEKEKDKTPSEDDLLPAAFRDEVDPKAISKESLVDQDLRDKDLRNIRRPSQGELLRAKSWSEVPTNFFDAEGKRGADVQEVRHDVDLRNMRDLRFRRRQEELGPRRLSQIPSLLSLPDPFEHTQRVKRGPPGQEPFPPRGRGGSPPRGRGGREDLDEKRELPGQGPFPPRGRGGREDLDDKRGPPGQEPFPLHRRGGREGPGEKRGPPGQEPFPPRRRGGREDPDEMDRLWNEEEAYYRRIEEEERKYGPVDDDWRPRRGTPPPEFVRRRTPPPEFLERLGPRGAPHRMRGPRMRGSRHQFYEHEPRGFPDEDPERIHVERMQRHQGLVRRGKEGSPFEGRYDSPERLPRPRHLPPPEFDDRVPRSRERIPEDFEERERFDEKHYPPPEYLDREMDRRRHPNRRMHPADPRRREFMVGHPREGHSPQGSPLHFPEHLQEAPPQPGRMNRPDLDHGDPYGVPPDARLPPERPMRIREPSPPITSGTLPYDPYQPGIPPQGPVYPNLGGVAVPVSQEGMIGLPQQLLPGQPTVSLAQGQPQFLPHSMPPVQASTSFAGPLDLPGQQYGLSVSIPQPLPTYVPTPQPIPSNPVTSGNFMMNLPQPEPLPGTSTAPALKSQVDINDLLSKLMSSGILAKPQSPAPEARDTPPLAEKEEKPEDSKPKEESSKENKVKDEKAAEEDDKVARKPKVTLPEELTLPREKRVVPPLSLDSSDLKQRYAGVIYSLLSGTQCSSCGMRFSMDMMSDYRQHLDWHFRQNRKDKDGIKSATSRKWYYELDEWLLFAEIDASEEGYRSAFFEQQAMEASLELEQEGAGVPVTGVEEDEYCKLCQEPFEQYWDEDDETWMLKDAKKVNNKTYHPTCFEDLKSNSIFGESSSSFHGIPGVGDDGDTLPGLGSPDHSMEEEEETVSNPVDVEHAKQKLAEILKPKQEIKPEEIQEKIKIESEPGTAETEKLIQEKIKIESEPGTAETEKLIQEKIKIESEPGTTETEKPNVEIKTEEKVDSEQDVTANVKEETVTNKIETKSETSDESLKSDNIVKTEMMEVVTDTILTSRIKSEPIDSTQSNLEGQPVATSKEQDEATTTDSSASAIVSTEPEKMDVDPSAKDVDPPVQLSVSDTPQEPVEPMETSQDDTSATVKVEPVEIKPSDVLGENSKDTTTSDVVLTKGDESLSISANAEEKSPTETGEDKPEQVIPLTDTKNETTPIEEQKDAGKVKEEKVTEEEVQSKELSSVDKT